MEIYKLIATIVNTETEYTLLYLPENFKGVKIAQNFNFNIPIGYTPKFSVETMRVVTNDKLWLDIIFDLYGLQSDVTINIQKLNATGIGYTDFLTFAIDFESYEKFDAYSEFALKSVSSYDLYANKKNTEKSYTLGASTANLPNTLNYSNYVSLKKSLFVVGLDSSYLLLTFLKNNESKIYDNDMALYAAITTTQVENIKNADIYRFGENHTSTQMAISFNGTLKFTISNAITTDPIDLSIKVYKNSMANPLYTIYEETILDGNKTFDISFNNKKDTFSTGSVLENDFLFILIFFRTITGESVFSGSGDFFVDIKKSTDSPIFTSANNSIKYLNTKTDILDDIFGAGKVVTTNSAYLQKGLTSANHLAKNSDVVTLKPQEFISDLCKMLGLVINSKIDGTTQIEKFSNYFGSILNSVPIELTDYRDVSIKQNTDLSFNSISVGQESKDYTVYAYLLNWFKVLTFKQTGRYGTENFDISLSKFRTDFSGMLDYYLMRSALKNKDYKDNFIFDAAFPEITASNETSKIYDAFTPRNMLTNWKRFLSFCFQNFQLNTLTLSSNGGTADNLEISGVNQMDDVVLSELPRLLPIEYNLTCTIDLIDFSENTIRIFHDGANVDLFIIKSETTDRINEQKITGLKIQRV